MSQPNSMLGEQAREIAAAHTQHRAAVTKNQQPPARQTTHHSTRIITDFSKGLRFGLGSVVYAGIICR